VIPKPLRRKLAVAPPSPLSDAITRFTAIQDTPDFVVGALKSGDYIEGRVLVSYELRDGLIARISVRRGGEMVKYSAGAQT
jgi:hypothetical protein